MVKPQVYPDDDVMDMMKYIDGCCVQLTSELTESDFISINICGMQYETLNSTLERFPLTLLGSPQRRSNYYVKSKDAYYFDRNRECFEAILYYYQSGGILIRPPNIPMTMFAEEVSFFELGEVAFSKLQANEGYVAKPKIILPDVLWKKRIWQLFEHPNSSMGARCLAYWSIFVIVLSITVFCLETMPIFGIIPGNATGQTILKQTSYPQPWFSLEISCIIWFTFEYLMRFISAPNKWQFSKSFLNVIDLLVILPYFISLSINQAKTPLNVLRVIRLVRVFRIFKLSRHSCGLRTLGLTLKASVSALGMLVFFLLLGIILFSSAIFYAEHGQNDKFHSIPDAFWYSIVTMTTVGYGDKYPITFPGKIIGSLCAISGVLTIAIPVPVIVSNFEFYYKRDCLSYDKKEGELSSPSVSLETKEKLLNSDLHLCP